MGGGKPERATEKRRYGLPPLSKLRAIMDACGYTREQIASRSGLSQPTVSRAIQGREHVRSSTAERVARAVGVPVKALYDDFAFAELRGQLKLPPVVAGRGYGYPRTSDEEGAPVGESPTGCSVEPPEGDTQIRGEGRQYVIVHRDEWTSLHETLAVISGRLSAIEEAVGELATRPVAQFDVDINLKEKGR